MELEDLKNDADAAEDRAVEWIGGNPKWALGIGVLLLIIAIVAAAI